MIMKDLNEKNEFDYYEKIKDWNFDEFEIETEYLTDWDMYEILEKITDSNSRVLDLGTGGGEKVLARFPEYLKEIVATDYSKEMIDTAKAVELNSVDMNDLDDLEEIKIDRRKEPNERIIKFLSECKNPYVFKYKNHIVRFKFSNNDVTADDCLTNLLDKLYR